MAEYLPGISREAPCGIHARASGPGTSLARTAWPPEVAREMGGAGFAEAAGEVASLRIVSPVDGGEYVPEGEGCRMVFTAAAPSSSGDLFWFLDGERVGKAPAGAGVRWTLPPGAHEVVAVDGSGRSARASFAVLAGR
jgi:membrane carboxypeptidase/penicillin-binding protein PbpC